MLYHKYNRWPYRRVWLISPLALVKAYWAGMCCENSGFTKPFAFMSNLCTILWKLYGLTDSDYVEIETQFKIRNSFRQKKNKPLTAKQLCVCSISTSEKKKSIWVSNGLRELRRVKCFFFSVPHTSLKKCLLVFSVILFLSYFISIIFALSSNSDIHVCPRMSVTNCSPTLWQWFFSFPCLFMTSFFPFFLFFCSFLQGLAHLTLNSQGMGLFCFCCSFFEWGTKKTLLLPKLSLPSSSI